jgi:hypothetical protein
VRVGIGIDIGNTDDVKLIAGLHCVLQTRVYVNSQPFRFLPLPRFPSLLMSAFHLFAFIELFPPFPSPISALCLQQSGGTYTESMGVTRHGKIGKSNS